MMSMNKMKATVIILKNLPAVKTVKMSNRQHVLTIADCFKLSKFVLKMEKKHTDNFDLQKIIKRSILFNINHQKMNF
jgi:hypothetical protein